MLSFEQDLGDIFLGNKKSQDSVKNGQLFRFEDFYQIQFVKNGLLDCK